MKLDARFIFQLPYRHLNRANKPSWIFLVRSIHRSRMNRVKLCKHFKKLVNAFIFQIFSQILIFRKLGCWYSVNNRLYIKSGSSHQNQKFSPSFNINKNIPRKVYIVGNAEALFWVHQIITPHRNSSYFVASAQFRISNFKFRIYRQAFACAYIHSFVNLARVG